MTAALVADFQKHHIILRGFAGDLVLTAKIVPMCKTPKVQSTMRLVREMV